MNRIPARFGWLHGSLSMLTLAAVVSSLGCPGTTPPPDEDDVIFPEDYRASYTVVRDCRNSIEHGATIRVWVNAESANAYLENQSPLPEGTVVVKEEFAAAGCDDDAALEFWSVMRKEATGFDPAASDWRFQEVAAPQRQVTIDNKAVCIGCHTAPSCLARDLMCTVP